MIHFWNCYEFKPKPHIQQNSNWWVNELPCDIHVTDFSITNAVHCFRERPFITKAKWKTNKFCNVNFIVRLISKSLGWEVVKHYRNGHFIVSACAFSRCPFASSRFQWKIDDQDCRPQTTGVRSCQNLLIRGFTTYTRLVHYMFCINSNHASLSSDVQ